jgi:hypothetical protein
LVESALVPQPAITALAKHANRVFAAWNPMLGLVMRRTLPRRCSVV